MPLLLALAASTLVYTIFGLLCERLWGPPVRSDALARELSRITNTDRDRGEAPWRHRLRLFFFPAEVADRAAFVRTLLMVALAGYTVGGLIFGSALVGTLLALGFIPYRFYLVQHLRRTRLETLNLQFKDALASIASSLRAGASLPTAVARAHDDLRRIFHGQAQQPMVEELARMIKEMQMGGSVEDALIRFRDRAGLEDVADFVNSALLCKTRGGNLPEVMATVAQIISDKVSVRRQVQVLTAGKRMEATLLTSVPPVLIGTLALMSPDYMAPLFSRLIGQLLAAVGVMMLVAAYFIGRKIVEIEV